MTERMSVADYRTQLQGGAAGGDRRRVRGTQRITVDAIEFDSKHEAQRYSSLCMMQRAGLIANLKLQEPHELWSNMGPIMTKSGNKIRRYFVDFEYDDLETGETVREDAKGFDTEVSELKRAIMAAMGKPVRIV